MSDNPIEVRTAEAVRLAGDNEMGRRTSVQVLELAFRRLFAGVRAAATRPSHNDYPHFSDYLSTSMEQNADLYGQCVQFASMLSAAVPHRHCEYMLWNNIGSAQPLHHLLVGWANRMPPLDKGEETPETWKKFFLAVAQYEIFLGGNAAAGQRATELIADLTEHAPRYRTRNTGGWTFRVQWYAQEVAPEYRRWFSHLLDPADVRLPLI